MTYVCRIFDALKHSNEITCLAMIFLFLSVVLAFQIDGRLPQNKFEFDSEEVCFNRRFAPFTCIVTPPCIPYHQYKEITNMDG